MSDGFRLWRAGTGGYVDPLLLAGLALLLVAAVYFLMLRK
jgi:hypothetical protein